MKKAKLLRSWGRSSSLFDENSEAIENRFNIDLNGIEYDFETWNEIQKGKEGLPWYKNPAFKGTVRF